MGRLADTHKPKNTPQQNNLKYIIKEGKKKESSFNGLDFKHMQFFTFFVQLIKKWSKTKLLQIKIFTYLYK